MLRLRLIRIALLILVHVGRLLSGLRLGWNEEGCRVGMIVLHRAIILVDTLALAVHLCPEAALRAGDAATRRFSLV